MIEAERIGKRSEAKSGRALGDGGEEQAGRGRRAQRRAVVLGHVIGVETRPFIDLGQPQAVFILAPQVGAGPVQVIEDGELHIFLLRQLLVTSSYQQPWRKSPPRRA